LRILKVQRLLSTEETAMNRDWKYPPYDKEELKVLCQNSSGNDFYFGLGHTLDNKRFVIITPKQNYGSYGELFGLYLHIDHLLPQGLSRWVGSLDPWDEYNIYVSEKSMDELRADFVKAGFIEEGEIYKFIELWFFKKSLVPNEYMDFSEFQELMEQTTENLRKMRAAQEYMKWQFGTPLYYEDFISEMSETTEGWIASHC
jgi:hypothetical protein